MYTEEEAKKKWCPQVRITLIADEPTPGHNRVCMDGEIYNADGSNCIASECMMWRKDREELVNTGRISSASEYKIFGYCGLAGKK